MRATASLLHPRSWRMASVCCPRPGTASTRGSKALVLPGGSSAGMGPLGVGTSSMYLDVNTQASRDSLNSPLGITSAGFAARRSPPSQHGHAYLTRSCRITRSCCGMMFICSLVTTPISFSTAPSCGHTRSDSGSSCRTTWRGRLGSSSLRPRFTVRLCAGTLTVSSPSSTTSSTADCAWAPRASASLKNMSFWWVAPASLLAANN